MDGDQLDESGEDLRNHSLKSSQYKTFEARNERVSCDHDSSQRIIGSHDGDLDSSNMCRSKAGIKRRYTSDDENEETITIAKKSLIVENCVDINFSDENGLEHPAALPLLFSLTSESEMQNFEPPPGSPSLPLLFCRTSESETHYLSNSAKMCGQKKGKISALESRDKIAFENYSSENTREVPIFKEFQENSVCEKLLKPAFGKSPSKILDINVNKNIQNRSLGTTGCDFVSCNNYDMHTRSFKDTADSDNSEGNEEHVSIPGNSLPCVSLETDNFSNVSVPHTSSPTPTISNSSFTEISLPAAISLDSQAVELSPKSLSILAAAIPDHSQTKKIDSRTMDRKSNFLRNSIICANFQIIGDMSAPEHDDACWADVNRCDKTLFDETLKTCHTDLGKLAVTNDNQMCQSLPFRNHCEGENGNKVDSDTALHLQDNDSLEKENDKLFVIANVQLPLTENLVLDNENKASWISNSLVNSLNFNGSGSNQKSARDENLNSKEDKTDVVLIVREKQEEVQNDTTCEPHDCHINPIDKIENNSPLSSSSDSDRNTEPNELFKNDYFMVPVAEGGETTPMLSARDNSCEAVVGSSAFCLVSVAERGITSEKLCTLPTVFLKPSDEIMHDSINSKLSSELPTDLCSAKGCVEILINENVKSCPVEVIELKVKFDKSVGDKLNRVRKLDASQEDNEGNVKFEGANVLSSSAALEGNFLVIEPQEQLIMTSDNMSDLQVSNVSISSQHLSLTTLCDSNLNVQVDAHVNVHVDAHMNIKEKNISVATRNKLTDDSVDSNEIGGSRVFLNMNPEPTDSSSNCASTAINIAGGNLVDAHGLSKMQLKEDLKKNALNSFVDCSPIEIQKQPFEASVLSPTTSDKSSSTRPMGKLLMDLGLQVVSKQVFHALIGIEKRNLHRNKNATEQSHELLAKLEVTHRELVKANLTYRCGSTLRCRCGFCANSTNVFEHHREYGEEIGYGIYRCCFCKDGDEGDEDFRSSSQLQRHMEAEHDRTYRPTQRWHHRCHYCTYVHNTLNTMLTHRRKCGRLFNLARNLEPNKDDIDIPLSNPSSFPVNLPSTDVPKLPSPKIECIPKVQPTLNISVQLPPVPSGLANTKVLDRVPSPRICFDNPWRFTAPNYNHVDFTLNSVRTSGAPNLNYQVPPLSPFQSQVCPPNFSWPIPRLPLGLEGINNFNFQLRNVLMNAQFVPNFNYGVRDTTPSPSNGAPNFNYQRPSLSTESLPSLKRYVLSLQPSMQPVFGSYGGLSFPNSVSLSSGGGCPVVTPRISVSLASSGGYDKPFQVNQLRTTVSNQFCRPDRMMYSPNQAASVQMCPICQGFVRDSAVMAVHLRLCHPMICQQQQQQRPQAPPTPDQVLPPIYCFACTPPASFLNQSLLQQHQSLLHNTKNISVAASAATSSAQTICWFCSTSVDGNLTEHMESKHQLTLWIMLKRYMCYLCPEQLVDVSAFENHMLCAHSRLFPALERLWSNIGDSIPLAELQTTGLNIDFGQFGESKCPSCRDVFLNRSFLYRHFFLNHFMNSNTKLPLVARPSVPAKSTKCPFCGLSVLEGVYYYRHLRRVHTRSCTVSIVRLDKEKFKRYYEQFLTRRKGGLEDKSVTGNVTSNEDKRSVTGKVTINEERGSVTSNSNGKRDKSVTGNVTKYSEDRNVTSNANSKRDKSVTGNVISNGDKCVMSNVHVLHEIHEDSPDQPVDLRKVNIPSLKVRLDLRKIEREKNERIASVDKNQETRNSSKRCNRGNRREKREELSDVIYEHDDDDDSMPVLALCSPIRDRNDVQVSPHCKRLKQDDVTLIISEEEEEEASVLPLLHLEREFDGDDFCITRNFEATASNLKNTKKRKKSSRTRLNRLSRDKSIK